MKDDIEIPIFGKINEDLDKEKLIFIISFLSEKVSDKNSMIQFLKKKIEDKDEMLKDLILK